MINFFRVFDSLFDKIILSSNASRLLERRARWEIDQMMQEFLKMSSIYNSKLLYKCISENPVEIVKQNKFRKQGGIHYE